VKVRFLIQAQLELDDAVAWYNQRFEGLGQEFLDELDRVVRRAIKFPLSCPEIEPGIRRGLIARFPYGLIYGIDDDRPRRYRRSSLTSPSPLLDRANLKSVR